MPLSVGSRAFAYRDGFLFARIIFYLSEFRQVGQVNDGGREAIRQGVELLEKSLAFVKFFGHLSDELPGITTNELDSTELLRNFLLARAEKRGDSSLEEIEREVAKIVDTLRGVCDGAAAAEDVKLAERFAVDYFGLGLGWEGTNQRSKSADTGGALRPPL